MLRKVLLTVLLVGLALSLPSTALAEDGAISLMIALDTSASMAAEWPLVRSAVLEVLDNLNPGDRLFLFGFDGSPRALLNPLTVKGPDSIQEVMEVLNRLRPVGRNTNYSELIFSIEALQKLNENLKVFIFTDGIGERNNSFSKHTVPLLPNRHSFVYTIGFQQPQDAKAGQENYQGVREAIQAEIAQLFQRVRPLPLDSAPTSQPAEPESQPVDKPINNPPDDSVPSESEGELESEAEGEEGDDGAKAGPQNTNRDLVKEPINNPATEVKEEAKKDNKEPDQQLMETGTSEAPTAQGSDVNQATKQDPKDIQAKPPLDSDLGDSGTQKGTIENLYSTIQSIWMWLLSHLEKIFIAIALLSGLFILTKGIRKLLRSVQSRSRTPADRTSGQHPHDDRLFLRIEGVEDPQELWPGLAMTFGEEIPLPGVDGPLAILERTGDRVKVRVLDDDLEINDEPRKSGEEFLIGAGDVLTYNGLSLWIERGERKGKGGESL